MFESFAQNCEDIVLWRALGHIANGTYVDVGAADPQHDSVTKAFYDRGWSGLNVEPAPEFGSALLEQRPRDITIQECAGDAAGTVTFHHVPGTGLSTLVSAAADAAGADFSVMDEAVPMRRLDSMLDEHGFRGRDIHFLKIDVEGFEESVLRGIDLREWRPWVVLVEATAPRGTQQVHHAWEPMLLESGYVFCLFDGLNRFYLASEREAIGLALTAPACVFDQPYVTPPHAALLKEYDNAIDGYHKLEELYEKAISDFETMNGRYLQTVADYQRLEGAHLQTVADYQRLEGAHLQTVADYERLSELLEQQAKELGGLESASSAMKFELQLLQDQRDVLRVGVATMGGEFDSLRAERDMWRGEAELMRTTLSRRVTRPLRAVRRLLR